jgi:protein tyrosine/serine phosphatase
MNKELIKEIELIANQYNIDIIKDNNREFTKEFIKKFQDKVDWNEISFYQKLSEEFFEEFQNKIN